MDPLRGDVFSPADPGEYHGHRALRGTSRYCRVCQRETREAKAARLFVGVLVGYMLAVAVWLAMGQPC